MTHRCALFRFRTSMMLFIVGLVLSGVTAFPLLSELRLLVRWLGLQNAASPEGHSGLEFWILTVKFGLEAMYSQYLWIAYGTDWLGFGHIVIALFFVGAWLKPAQSRMTIWIGVIACGLVLPLALIAGPLRGIPFYWRLIDCSFGVFGVIPLAYCLRVLPAIEKGE